MYPVVSLETLLAMKRASARPKDLLDITELEHANPTQARHDLPSPRVLPQQEHAP